MGRAKVAEGEYVERALGRHHQGVYGLGEWREMVDEKTGEAYRISRRDGPELTLGLTCARVSMVSSLPM